MFAWPDILIKYVAMTLKLSDSSSNGRVVRASASKSDDCFDY